MTHEDLIDKGFKLVAKWDDTSLYNKEGFKVFLRGDVATTNYPQEVIEDLDKAYEFYLRTTIREIEVQLKANEMDLEYYTDLLNGLFKQ